MNKKLMKTLKFGFLILGISLFFTNCDSDEIISENGNNTIINTDSIANNNLFGFTIQTLELKDIESNTEVFDEIENIKNKSNKSNKANRNNKSLKTVFSSDESFIIDTGIVKYLQNQDSTYHSYTFPIYRANNNSGLENLMLSSQDDETYKTYIVTYDLTEQEILDLNNNLPVDLKNKVTHTEFKDEQLVNNIFSRKSRLSTTVFVVFEGPCTHEVCQSSHGSGGCAHPNSSTSSFTSNTSPGAGHNTNYTGNQSNQNNYNFGGATSPTSSRTVKESLIFYISEILGLNGQEKYRLKSLNTRDLEEIKTFLIDNNAEEAKEFINWKIEFEKLPTEPCGINHDCVESIQTMADGLRNFHGEDGELMADYFDSLISDFSSFTRPDLQVFYDTASDITKQYNAKMRNAIIFGFAEGVTPILEIALLEVGGPVAIKLLKRIPVSWVLRGNRLNKMVGKIGLLGVQGTSNSIRIVTTNGAPYSKALELFKTLTKNSQPVTVASNGTRVALFGNGNKIVFRAQSSSGFPATLELTFSEVWTNTRIVKFQ